jgi:hypothetical protein
MLCVPPTKRKEWNDNHRLLCLILPDDVEMNNNDEDD